MAEGPRAVRARAALARAGAWAKFREFPGWDNDMDAPAACRSRETAVVVLEPHVNAHLAPLLSVRCSVSNQWLRWPSELVVGA